MKPLDRLNDLARSHPGLANSVAKVALTMLDDAPVEGLTAQQARVYRALVAAGDRAVPISTLCAVASCDHQPVDVDHIRVVLTKIRARLGAKIERVSGGSTWGGGYRLTS